VIDRFRREPCLVAFELATPLKLLDLTGSFATRTGASMALMTGLRAVARRWVPTFYEAYLEVQGMYYPSSMYANAPAIALNERAVAAGTMLRVPGFHRALADNALHKSAALYLFPSIARHNAFHKFVKQRYGEGGVTVIGAPYHATLDQVIPDGRYTLNRAFQFSGNIT